VVTTSLFEFLLLVNEGVETGMELTNCYSPLLALAVNEMTVSVPFQLQFHRDCGFFVLASGTSWKANLSPNFARATIQWQLPKIKEIQHASD
jgi:hypothetical protein